MQGKQLKGTTHRSTYIQKNLIFRLYNNQKSQALTKTNMHGYISLRVQH